MEDVDAGDLERAEVALDERGAALVPAQELRPVESEQRQHVDDARAQDQVRGAGRDRGPRAPEQAAAAEIEHRRAGERGGCEEARAKELAAVHAARALGARALPDGDAEPRGTPLARHRSS